MASYHSLSPGDVQLSYRNQIIAIIFHLYVFISPTSRLNRSSNAQAVCWPGDNTEMHFPRRKSRTCEETREEETGFFFFFFCEIEKVQFNPEKTRVSFSPTHSGIKCVSPLHIVVPRPCTIVPPMSRVK